MKPKNYFDVLGVDEKASIGEIKKAYRQLAFKYHPDHNQNEITRRKYIEITNAYKVLADPLKRDEYVKKQSNAVTDEPWTILEKYWGSIFTIGFQPGAKI